MANAQTPRKKTTSAAKPRATARAKSALPAQRPGAMATDSADWRDDMIERVRTLITQADPQAIEEVKWRKPSNSMAGVPVWSRNGIICTGERYKGVVKLTFARGAALDDPTGLFNAGLAGGTRRAIDIREGDTLNATAFKALVRAAVAMNTVAAASPTRRTKTPAAKKAARG